MAEVESAMRKFWLIPVAWTCLGPVPAAAQPLPGWSIAEICAKDATPGQCRAFEGQAWRAVSGSWSFVPEAIRKACLADIKAPYLSYRSLADCIDVEMRKANDINAVQTRATPADPVPPPKPATPVSAPPAPVAPPPAPPAATASPPSAPAAAPAPPAPAPIAPPPPPTEPPKADAPKKE
jgi:hypothetical protein